MDDHGIEGVQIAHGSGGISTHLDLLCIDLEGMEETTMDETTMDETRNLVKV